MNRLRGSASDHEREVWLVDRLEERMLKKYGNEVLLGGLYGSTVKDTSVELSDLEMGFVVRDGPKAKSFAVQEVAEVEKGH
jgi:hypothetical protein